MLETVPGGNSSEKASELKRGMAQTFHSAGVAGVNVSHNIFFILADPPISSARLDPDGNEIPSDEEEELERVRTERRLRAQSRARGPAENASARPALLYPAPTVILLEDEAELQPDNSRVQPGERGLIHRNVGDLVESVSSPVSQDSESSLITLFHADPLPMPLEKMIWSPSQPKHLHVAWIPKHASLAGR